MKYDIRKIKEKDNKEVESLIRTCLIEFGANHLTSIVNIYR